MNNQVFEKSIGDFMYRFRTLSTQLQLTKRVTTGEFAMLRLIHKTANMPNCHNNRITPTNLNQLMHTTKPATSRMLALLEEKGYLERLQAPKDRRVTYICLTPLGEEVLKEEIDNLNALSDRIVDKMGKEDMEQMMLYFHKFNGILLEMIEENIKN